MEASTPKATAPAAGTAAAMSWLVVDPQKHRRGQEQHHEDKRIHLDGGHRSCSTREDIYSFATGTSADARPGFTSRRNLAVNRSTCGDECDVRRVQPWPRQPRGAPRVPPAHPLVQHQGTTLEHAGAQDGSHSYDKDTRGKSTLEDTSVAVAAACGGQRHQKEKGMAVRNEPTTSAAASVTAHHDGPFAH